MKRNATQKAVLKLAQEMLDSEHGVTSAAYYQLFTVMQEVGLTNEITTISNRTKAVEGQFYVKEGALNDLQED